MLEIVCENCGTHYFVKGYTTADSWTEPGEVVTDLELTDDTEDLCDCLKGGESFWVVDEEHAVFDDDVI